MTTDSMTARGERPDEYLATLLSPPLLIRVDSGIRMVIHPSNVRLVPLFLDKRVSLHQPKR